MNRCTIVTNDDAIILQTAKKKAGGYVAFSLDVPASVLSSSAANELFVLADNRFNHTTAPMHTGGDFWHYGGLIRSVELHAMQSAGQNLWRAYVMPSGTDATVPTTKMPDSVDITLALADKTYNGPISYTLAFDGGAPSAAASGTAANGELKVLGVKVPSPTLWAPGSPNLHTVEVTVNGGSVVERFGLRAFGTASDIHDSSPLSVFG